MNAGQVWSAPFELWNDLYVGVADTKMERERQL